MPLAAGLAGIGGLHVVWAFGQTWPYATKEEFTRHLVGRGDFPPFAASITVGAGLLVASHLTLARGGFVPKIGPAWVHGVGGVGLTAVLLGRGLLGPLMHGGATQEYIDLDRRVYSPLCLALGALALAMVVDRPARPDTAAAADAEAADAEADPTEET